MLSSWPTERAKPLLGTVVRVRARGLDMATTHQALDAAFQEIAAIHALMSFHEDGSDVSRLNREAWQSPVTVDPRTYEVLVHACALSAMTEGTFDVSVAPQLVARGHLPKPHGAPEPDRSAIWRDIQFLPDMQIKFAKPLWLDLGGIAKGYAVDRAMDVLKAYAPTQACVNAGGDLRVTGDGRERVRLGSDSFPSQDFPIVDIHEGSLASSCGSVSGRRYERSGLHIDARSGNTALPVQFVSVAAPRCMDADALTKVVMARGACAAKVLARFGAQAVVHDAQFGWREVKGHA